MSTLTRKDIAMEAGVTAPSVSYYYPNLDELLLDVYERYISVYMEQGPLILQQFENPWSQLTAIIDKSLPTGPTDIDSIIMYQFSGEPRFAKIYSEASSKLHKHEENLYVSIIQSGIGRGIFQPDLNVHVLARALSALIDAYGIQVVGDEPGVDHHTALIEIEKIIASLLRFERSQ